MKPDPKLRAAASVAVVAVDAEMTVAMIAGHVSAVNPVGKTQRSKAFEGYSGSCLP
jgi:hypothetical protein